MMFESALEALFSRLDDVIICAPKKNAAPIERRVQVV